ncbi:ATP-grasp fold amidoligase family protein [Pinibacter aurantiacus]|uniref:Uncharacterized protein n=1 Tax=Pinibacter aurantiacus TaxID=2851599 RepID=A0A9E2S8K7_9BACT|nr:ATP-grasp fold amidoligase family protein [Pinibacter aurantiacus]MBV4356908.1 hypothetical protein [Pinibacter aurantiacus]
MVKKIIKKILPDFLLQKVRYFYWRNRAKKLSENIFFDVFKRPIDWEHPKDLNEKIHWLKFYSDTTLWSELADKYKVREYVKNKGLGHMLNELYAKFEKAEDIDISALPQSFIMKINNGCGGALVVNDKSLYNNKDVRKYFRKQAKENFFVFTGECHYGNITPCITAEKLLTEDLKEYSSRLIDYKFFCFDGKPEAILVYLNAYTPEQIVLLYDLEWNKTNDILPLYSSNIDVPRPKSLKEMISACKQLAQGIPHVRVDFYEIGGKPIFGELTFTSGAGFMERFTEEALNRWGDLVTLPPRK